MYLMFSHWCIELQSISICFTYDLWAFLLIWLLNPPKNVTTATQFRYFSLSTSSLPNGKHTPITRLFFWQVFWGVYQVLEELNIILPWVKQEPAGTIYPSNYKKMWETTGCLYGVGQSPKGQPCVKDYIMAMSLELSVILESSDLTRLISTWFHDQIFRVFSLTLSI